MDFTLKQYTNLLKSLKQAGFLFQTFEGFIENPLPRAIVLRHDVDLLPQNFLAVANTKLNMN